MADAMAGHSDSAPGQGPSTSNPVQASVDSLLRAARKTWRKAKNSQTHSWFARPEPGRDGVVQDIYRWRVGFVDHLAIDRVVLVQFNQHEAHIPPVCYFPRGFFHLNVFPSGLLTAYWGVWPGLKGDVFRWLIGFLRNIMEHPQLDDPAQAEAYRLYKAARCEYEARYAHQPRMEPMWSMQ